MIPRLAAVFALALVAASCGGNRAPTEASRVLEITVGPAMPVPDEEDLGNTLQNRYWFVRPRVAIRLLRACSDVKIVTVSPAFTDRTARRRAWSGDETTDAEGPGRHGRGYVLVDTTADAYSIWGVAIRFTAKATCRRRGKLVRAQATRWFDLPSGSCATAPLLAFVARDAERRDDTGNWSPIGSGTTLSPRDVVRVRRGGRLELGTPECNAFAATLTRGSYNLGGYDPKARGPSFEGARASLVGDSHAGGFSVADKLVVEPLDLNCGDCLTQPSKYDIRAQSPQRATVRVRQGSVYASGPGGGRTLVPAGMQADSVCTGSVCRLSKRLFQDNEPWSLPVAGPRPFVRRFVVPPGQRLSWARLAPPNADLNVHVLRAAAGVPKQYVVTWTRSVRVQPDEPYGERTNTQGVFEWQASDSPAGTEWRVVYGRRFGRGEPTATVGDVTEDGHADALLVQENGSGGCGPHILVATVGSRVREIFRRETCETHMTLGAEALVIDGPVGPCPYPTGSAHCFGGTMRTVMRWNGRSLVPTWTHVRCYLRRLDPARHCERKTRG